MSDLPFESESSDPLYADIARRMRVVFAEVFCISEELVSSHFDEPLYEYTSVDSQKLVELIIQIEQEFEIIIPGNDGDEFSGHSSARSFCEYVQKYI